MFSTRSLSSPEETLCSGSEGAGGVSAAFESVRLANRRTRTLAAGRNSVVVSDSGLLLALLTCARCPSRSETTLVALP